MREMKFKAAVIVALSFVLIVGGLLQTGYAEENDGKRLFRYPDEFWVVYFNLSGALDEQQNSESDLFQENGRDYINYFVMARKALRNIYYAEVRGRTESIEETRTILDCLKATFDEHGYFPRPEYETLKYGWVSSMDAPVIMLASELMYEYTGEEKYHDFSMSMLPYALEPVEKRGYNLELSNGGKWPLEYAWTEAKEDNSKFVLNGSLVGYLSLRALSDIYDDALLNEYLESVEQAYASKMLDFHKGGSWSYYMLNDKTVVPIHYIVFEKKLFRACYLLTGNEMFDRESNYRAGCLKDTLKAQFYEEQDGVTYYMVRACSPNPYQIDTHTTTLEFLNDKREIISSRVVKGSGSMADRKQDFYAGGFVRGTFLDETPSYYRVYSESGEDKYLLLEDEVNIERGNRDIEAGYTISLERDACYLDGTNERIVVFDPEKHEKVEGDVVFALDTPRKADGKEYYVLQIGNLAETNIPIGLIVYDSNSFGVSRYYTNLVPGMNAVSFTLDGFVNSEALDDVAKIWLRIYDQSIDPDDTMVYVGGMKVFNDNREYVNFINQYRYLISPQ